MKDDKLEKEFEEYFKGANTPNGITADAKKYVKPKTAFLPKFVKLASVAASFALVFAVAVAIVLKRNVDSVPTEPQVGYYTDADLDLQKTSAYAVYDLHPSLAFIQNLAVSSNASVDGCTAGYRDGKLTLVKADVNLLANLCRDETTVYVEFTDETAVYAELADYADGSKGSYGGINYYLTSGTAENGEPRYRLHAYYGGVKYYFDVRSTDRNAYEKYLRMIKN